MGDVNGHTFWKNLFFAVIWIMYNTWVESIWTFFCKNLALIWIKVKAIVELKWVIALPIGLSKCDLNHTLTFDSSHSCYF